MLENKWEKLKQTNFINLKIKNIYNNIALELKRKKKNESKAIINVEIRRKIKKFERKTRKIYYEKQ